MKDGEDMFVKKIGGFTEIKRRQRGRNLILLVSSLLANRGGVRGGHGARSKPTGRSEFEMKNMLKEITRREEGSEVDAMI